MDDIQSKAQAANEEIGYSSVNPEPIQLKESEALRNRMADDPLHATEEYINHQVD